MFKLLLLSCLARIFTLFVIAHRLLCRLIIRLLPKFAHSFTHLQNILSHPGSFHSCIQILVSCSLSLSLSLFLIDFQDYFIRFLLQICHQVHHSFLSMIFTDLPDYSQLLKQSLLLRHTLIYLFYLFGYLGISAQVYFLVDLIYLFNTPTILIYTLLSKTYTLLISVISQILLILSTDPQAWLSCEYHPIYLSHAAKMVYVGSCFFLGYAVIGVVFYYAWLATIMLVLQIVINAIGNGALIFGSLGSCILALKSLPLEQDNHQTSANSQEMPKAARAVEFTGKFTKLTAILMALPYVPILTYQKVVQILYGASVFSQTETRIKPIPYPIIPYRRVYHIFISAITRNRPH